jgi:para-nitrobenzyl esterase
MTSKTVLAVAVAGVLASTSAAAQVVQVQSGSLKGVTAGDVVSFKGIPYAAPPVGPLRWRAPQPVAPWTDVRAADKLGAICMQKIDAHDNGVGPGPASEDCLTLNVYAPAAQAAAPRPVMVWIHGGGFVNGSATAALYDGSALARQGVVVVTVNYRLGRFGFFAHPALTAEQQGQAVANYGLMDQIAALEWVKRNIGAFGGDPANVTIFGESAGGMAVNRLMMIHEAWGLFAKAIVESGVGWEKSQTLAEAEAAGGAFATKIGAGSDAASLRAIPADKIVAAGDPDVLKGELPILDGKLLTENPAEAFAAGRVARVPYLVGSNSLEFPNPGAAMIRPKIVHMNPEQSAAAVKAYGGQDAFDAHIVSDVIFGEPARWLAGQTAKRGMPTYLYRFSVVSAKAPKGLQGGAVHASDRQYVFKTLNASPWPTDARDAGLADTISAYWVAFAKTGDPNGEGRPSWPRYDERDELINFTNDGPLAETTPDAAALDFIAAAKP